jgi:NADPH-dependent glutamate synthase beta subunit-like oxidoreductase
MMSQFSMSLPGSSAQPQASSGAPNNYSFSIIGAGPVGLATALLMNKLGYQVSIYESHENISKEVRMN